MRFFEIKTIISFLVLTIIVFSILIFLGDYKKIIQSLNLVRLDIIITIMILALTGYIFRYFRWEYFLRISNIKIPFKTSFLIFFSGLSMAITPAKIGEVLKSYYLKKLEGIKMRKSIMIVFSERLTDILGLSILSLIGLIAFFIHAYFLIPVFIFIFLLIFILINEKIFFKLCKFCNKIPLAKKYSKYFKSIYKSSKVLLSFKSLTITTLISIISWFFECSAFYLLLNSLGVFLTLLSAIFIFSFSSIFGSVLVLPGGLGAAEGSFVVLLLLLGVPIAIASLSTIIFRIFTLFFGVILGAIALVLINKKL